MCWLRTPKYWYGKDQIEIALDVADHDFETHLSITLELVEAALSTAWSGPKYVASAKTTVLQTVRRAEVDARAQKPSDAWLIYDELASRTAGSLASLVILGKKEANLTAEQIQAWEKEFKQPSLPDESPAHAATDPRTELGRQKSLREGDYRAYAPSPPVPWMFSISSDFRKSVARLDKKLQGRILEALTDLSQTPMRLRGDTMKPLSGELLGKWRYRIGDYRLIYAPDERAHTVLLLAVFPRGTAYVD